MYKLWIIEDELALAQGLKIAFEKEGNYSVSLAPSLGDLKELLSKETPDIVLLDIRLPDGDGLDALPHILKASPQAKIIVMTAFGESALIVKAIKEGAYNYLDKPFPLEAARNMVARAAENISLERAVSKLNEDTTVNLTGSSPQIQQIRAFVEKVSKVPDLNILIKGESGSGKEVLARLIHRTSGYKGNFVALNCAAIPENLLEAELFGYKKGAYTGAVQDKMGLVELSDGGTLFLDEIGDMPLPLQGKLLRFLDSRTYRPLGGTKEIKVSLRVISATCQNIEEKISKGEFRRDLYYRIAMFPIIVPPLRERGKDVLEIFHTFVDQYSKSFKRLPLSLTPEVEEVFLNYSWPGNCRELKNLVERLFILKDPNDRWIRLGDLPDRMLDDLPNKGKALNSIQGHTLQEKIESFERQLIEEALGKTQNNKSKAAEILGISRFALLRRMQKYGIE
ncbi:sigma-54 dependent transcriptional regulator [Thermovirga sp.]|uniref:sigma-54-dependent transcriptional regulator n=1 Tax=Thermovirga sp. TaxID=2699834 RepID=UPI0025D391FA|nr:sigma-54 dependent transcriptional regulator [Thermovirga sp.]MBO8154631.1 sigma-54-dependent Fis family transcriptional regulator [Thermovirga sp.]